MGRDCRIETVPLIDSTNRAVKDLAEQGAPEGLVFFAEEQTAGRGRMGRSFFSPPGSGLYFSVLLRPKDTDPLKITVAAGVAVARAVQETLGLELQIKWVNDLYFKNKKVCGILAEGLVSEEGLEYCVLGVGVNVFAPRAGFGELDVIAGALLEEPRDGLRAKLAAAILNHFSALYENLEDPAILQEYRGRSYLQGKTVTALRGNERFRAMVVGIDDTAALLLKRENGQVVALSSGEVQLEDYR
ncbi:MAG: biotin--[Clostridia bacterium]|nr:biotin--[acetyl-CoA-carboxylase] ligase [Clostridia bacterium]